MSLSPPIHQGKWGAAGQQGWNMFLTRKIRCRYCHYFLPGIFRHLAFVLCIVLQLYVIDNEALKLATASYYEYEQCSVTHGWMRHIPSIAITRKFSQEMRLTTSNEALRST